MPIRPNPGFILASWYNEDRQLHRLDGPALVRSDGSEFWYLNGKLHHLNGPAITFVGGSEFWAFGIEYESLEELTIGIVIDQ